MRSQIIKLNAILMIVMLFIFSLPVIALCQDKVYQTNSAKQHQNDIPTKPLEFMEDFEKKLSTNWTLDSNKQANISSEVAHSSKYSLKFAYSTDKLVPSATWRFQSLKTCKIEFWLHVSDRGYRFSGWESMGFGWKLLWKDKKYDGPVYIDLHWDQTVEGMTDKKSKPPETDLIPRIPKGGNVSLWSLKEQFPVGKWFKVQMIIHANRHIEFFIDEKYAGTIEGDLGESIDGIQWGGGLSLQAMNYIVYLDDVRVSYLHE